MNKYLFTSKGLVLGLGVRAEDRVRIWPGTIGCETSPLSPSFNPKYIFKNKYIIYYNQLNVDIIYHAVM